MHRAVIFISLAVAVLSENDFNEKYTFTKVMASCLGEDAYYDYLARVGIAQRECQQLPVSSLQTVGYPFYSHNGYPNHQPGYSPYPQHHTLNIGHPGIPQGYPPHHGIPQSYPPQSYPPQYGISYPHHQGASHFYPHQQGGINIYPPHHGGSQPYPQYYSQQNTYPSHHIPNRYSHYLHKRESNETPTSTEVPTNKPFFDKYYLLDSVNKITASLSNYTCVLHKLGFIDEYLNLHLDNYIEHFNQKPISEGLKKDLIDGVVYCRDLTYCLPLERLKSPLPLNLQRLLMAMKCEKETRTDACFKEDLRKNIHEFDLSLFPEDDTQESKLNKLSAIVMEVDSVDELQIL